MKKKYKNYTDSENAVLDWAVETTIQKYIKQGGNIDDMESRNFIDYFFCMLIYEKGIESVKTFVENYTYNPSQFKQPVYNPEY